jgi:F-type H+-transporting ATPase subunit delta
MAMRSKRQTARSARQLYRFCIVGGKLDEGRVRSVVDVAVKSNRRGVTAMLTKFQRLIRLDHERHTALVESSAPLSDDARAAITEGVANRHGAGIQTTFAENVALIGGMRIRVGSDVYDGSVRARLEAIESGM